jgi:hypothetical protein
VKFPSTTYVCAADDGTVLCRMVLEQAPGLGKARGGSLDIEIRSDVRWTDAGRLAQTGDTSWYKGDPDTPIVVDWTRLPGRAAFWRLPADYARAAILRRRRAEGLDDGGA